MFEKYMIRTGSLKNVVRNGKITGFQMDVRIAYYRGVYLSLIDGYDLTVDGVGYPLDKMSFAVNGKPPRTFSELRKATEERWAFGDIATLVVERPDGLASGPHEVELSQKILIAYGFGYTPDSRRVSPTTDNLTGVNLGGGEAKVRMTLAEESFESTSEKG